MIGAHFSISRCCKGLQVVRASATHIDTEIFENLFGLRRLQETHWSHAFSLAITCGGVPVGASRAYHTLASKSGNPPSDAVNTSGRPAKRLLLAIANPRSFPSRTLSHVSRHRIHGEIDMAAQQICNDGRTSAILRFAKLYLAALLQKLAGDMAERPVARKPRR